MKDSDVMAQKYINWNYQSKMVSHTPHAARDARRVKFVILENALRAKRAWRKQCGVGD